MKILGVTYLFIILITACFPGKGNCQSEPKNLRIQNILPGYKEKISGEVSGFHSSNPDANDALIARCTDKNNKISWKTAVIPPNYKDKYVYFAWLTALATGKNRQNSSYELSVNGNKAFDFNIVAKEASPNWTIKGLNGMELSFAQHWKDENGDSFGFTYLKVSVADYKKGESIRLDVQSVNTKRNDDFYMVFQHDTKEDVAILPRPLLRKENGKLQQLIAIQVNHILPQETNATIQGDGYARRLVKLKPGFNEIEIWVQAVKTNKTSKISINAPNILSFEKNVTLQPVAMRELYLVNHSHNDIGYSDLQTVVERKQNDYIRQAMELIDKSKEYPEGAKYIWNIEAMWAVENFMKQATAEEKVKLIKYAKEGSIGLPVGYANLLTGICRPEELIHLTDYADTLRRRYGINSKTMMISDVPGMSWNIVSALAQRGVRYISSGPNYIPHDGFPDVGGRVGATHRAWGDKPFYWVSASGVDTILYWQAGTGYSWFQDWNMGRLRFEHKPVNLLMNYLQKLQDEKYPYEMVQLSYAVINDNGKPDDGISDFVAEWNKKYVSPKMVITSVDNMMETFEQRYAKKLPVFAGDFTPYWEDGAMSTAREEALVKQSVERLYQSSVLNTLMFPGNYNGDLYYKAWRNAIMWHEHTWGAWNSISAPDDPNVIKQWLYKQNFALQADTLSRKLLQQGLDSSIDQKKGFNVINTSSWNRTDLVMLTKEQSPAGDIIVDENDIKYPSQRLNDGRLAFLAKDIPALGSKLFYNRGGNSSYKSDLKISDDYIIKNDAIRLMLDKNTGAIKSLVNVKTGLEFVDRSRYEGLNQYIYMPGLDPSKTLTTNNVQIKITESGPLISTFEITCKAPGTNSLKQKVSLVNELNRVDITDIIDKEKVRTKESVHFAFPVNVQNGQMRMDMGTGILLPGKNQLPGANKDYISMQRWADVSNNTAGLTFITDEVPLIEEGELVNEMPYAKSNSFGGVSMEKKWKDQSNLSNTFFSYAMNNYWYTNYKADQEGAVSFHYAVYLHNQFNASAANREGRASGQPLLITAGSNENINKQTAFKLNDENILLTSVKPAVSGKGIIIRLYNSSATSQRVQLNLNKGVNNKYPKIYLSNAKEDKIKHFDLQEAWPAFAVKTLYIEQ